MSRLLDRLTVGLLTRFALLCLAAQFLGFLYVQATPGLTDRLGRIRGRDFLQFYAAGAVVREGQPLRLYDQDHFRDRQQAIAPGTHERYYSLYPPAAALLAVPFALLPYSTAVVLWWLVSAVLFAAVARLLAAGRPPAERTAIWLGLFSFQPVVMNFWDGQLSAIWTLAVAVGLRWQAPGRRFRAGLALSALALKPQLALGLGLWLLLRRDGRALAGMVIGCLVQQGLVALVLGPGVLAAYLENARLYADLQRIYDFDPSYQHALYAILTGKAGTDLQPLWAGLHLGSVAVAAWLSWRIGRRDRGNENELAAAVLLMLVVPPHLLLYDLAPLAIAVALLAKPGSATRGPAALLYLAAMLAPVYKIIGFSLVPAMLAVGIWKLAEMAGWLSPSPRPSPPRGEGARGVTPLG